MGDNNNIVDMKRGIDSLKTVGNFDISVCDSVQHIEENPKYKKIELSKGQKMQLNSLINQLPAIMALDNMAALSSMPKLYSVTIPDGLPYTMMVMKNGNMTSVLRDQNGLFRGYANMAEYNAPANLALSSTVIGAFSAMSLATGQYYLNQINSELDKIKMGMDAILAFLHGDKKAELMSEISFVKYVYQNYNAISSSEAQRIASISGVQQAKKVGMKDCEFYIADFESAIENRNDICATVNNALRICDSLKLSLQLCTMGSILETYLSQNFDPNYIRYIENDMSLYIDKCEKVMLGGLSTLIAHVRNAKELPIKKIPKEKLIADISEVLDTLKESGESPLKKTMREGLRLADSQKTYYLSANGEVYIKSE